MNDIHNYFFGGWPEMPWKKDEEDEVNIWPNPDMGDWEPLEDVESDMSNYVYPDGRLCYDCKFSHTIEEHKEWEEDDREED